MIKSPYGPKEMLASFQSLLTSGELLKKDFYDSLQLEKFFGPGYRFTPKKDKKDQLTIYFDDRSNVYFDKDGNPTALNKTRPCLTSGMLVFEPKRPTQNARVSVSMMTIGATGLANSFNAETVLEIFGKPNAITEGAPTSPPLNGLAYRPTLKTNELGNSWLSYQAKTDGYFQRIKFRTLGNGTVIEIQIFEEEQ